MGESAIIQLNAGTWIWLGFGWQRLGPKWPIEICIYLPFLCLSIEFKKKTEKNKEDVHTNTIEGFWATVKRAWYGQHHHYSQKYLQYYISEAVFKYNNRKLDSSEAFTSLFKQVLVCTNS